MSNLHLVPANVIDIVEKLSNKDIFANEEMNYVLRLEAIRDYCQDAIIKSNNKPSKIFKKKIIK